MFQGLFNYDNPVWRFIGRLADIMILNVLWVICSLPIFTIGASTTALYYCTLKIVRDEDYGNFKMFFKSFRLNFKQATIIWLAMLLVGSILFGDFYFFGKVMTGNTTVRFILRAFTMALMLIWVFLFLYVWPLLSRFDNSIKKTVSNAIFMSMINIGNTLAILVTDVAIVIAAYFCFYYLPMLIPVILLLGFPLIAWINSTMFEHIFKKYMPKEETEAKREEELSSILDNIPLPEEDSKAEESDDIRQE